MQRIVQRFVQAGPLAEQEPRLLTVGTTLAFGRNTPASAKLVEDAASSRILRALGELLGAEELTFALHRRAMLEVERRCMNRSDRALRGAARSFVLRHLEFRVFGLLVVVPAFFTAIFFFPS